MTPEKMVTYDWCLTGHGGRVHIRAPEKRLRAGGLRVHTLCGRMASWGSDAPHPDFIGLTACRICIRKAEA